MLWSASPARVGSTAFAASLDLDGPVTGDEATGDGGFLDAIPEGLGCDLAHASADVAYEKGGAVSDHSRIAADVSLQQAYMPYEPRRHKEFERRIKSLRHEAPGRLG